MQSLISKSSSDETSENIQKKERLIKEEPFLKLIKEGEGKRCN